MFNKVSFILNEDHYPVCCLTLDEVGDNGLENIHTNADIIDSEDVIGNMARANIFTNKLYKCKISQTELQELFVLITQRDLHVKNEVISSSLYWNILEKGEKEVLSLLKNIQILLVDEAKLPNPPFAGDYSMEVLGCYLSISDDINKPAILLCPKKIYEVTNQLQNVNIQMDFDTLLGIVFIHELAHAIMDPTNIIDQSGSLVKKSAQSIETDRDLFIEESLANMITLQYYDSAAKDLTIILKFMEKQPSAYKFGIEQYNSKTNWRLWRDIKKSTRIN